MFRVKRQGCCRGSGKGRLAGGEVPADRRCTQLPPPERVALNIVPRQRHEEMPNDRGVVRGHTSTIGTDHVETDRASLASSCPLPRHATFVLCVPEVRAASAFDSRARHPRLTSHCRCRGNTLYARFESLMTLKLVRMLPPGEGRGEGLCHVKSRVNHRQSIKTSPSGELHAR